MYIEGDNLHSWYLYWTYLKKSNSQNSVIDFASAAVENDMLHNSIHNVLAKKAQIMFKQYLLWKNKSINKFISWSIFLLFILQYAV